VSENLASPCTRVCTIDPDTGFCIGCLRTLDEISRWVTMPDAERRAVRESLLGRSPSKALVCGRCGASFMCGASSRAAACWCMRYPPLEAPVAGGGCLCPGCLATLTEKAIG
jgi:predicted Fe-S protein YdhL (DUF1289 family)